MKYALVKITTDKYPIKYQDGTIEYWGKSPRDILDFCSLITEGLLKDVEKGLIKIVSEEEPHILDKCDFFQNFESELRQGKIKLREGQKKNAMIKNYCGYTFNTELSVKFCKLVKHNTGEAYGWLGKSVQFCCPEMRNIIKAHFTNQVKMCNRCYKNKNKAYNKIKTGEYKEKGWVISNGKC